MTQNVKQATAPQIGAHVTVDAELWEIISLGMEENGLVYARLSNVVRPELRIGRWLKGKAPAA